MFESLHSFFSRNKQQEKPKAKAVPFAYKREKEGKKYLFFSDIAMEEAQLTTAIDIIYDGARRDCGYYWIAMETFTKCFKEIDGGSISIESDEKREWWIIEITPDPLAFR